MLYRFFTKVVPLEDFIAVSSLNALGFPEDKIWRESSLMAHGARYTRCQVKSHRRVGATVRDTA